MQAIQVLLFGITILLMATDEKLCRSCILDDSLWVWSEIFGCPSVVKVTIAPVLRNYWRGGKSTALAKKLLVLREQNLTESKKQVKAFEWEEHWAMF